MTEKEVQKMIDEAIKSHEIRVGWISELLVLCLLSGSFILFG
jgi:hypoxanthine-guanine phosphoribosyltransferase